MKIIGEKINGTLKSIRKAIEERDAAFIQDLAQRQVDAGAHWLDVNAGTHPDREPENLAWLVKTVQEKVVAPLCIDTTNSAAMAAALKETNQTPLINSISGEADRLEQILPLAAQYKCPVIALAMDEKGIPKDAGARVDVVQKLIKKTREKEIPDDMVYIDPLVTALATDTSSGLTAFNTMAEIKAQFPQVHFCMGLSNISFGLPARALVNRTFLTLAVNYGLDSAILDPLDKALMGTIFATETVLGRDNYCMNYTKAFRKGQLTK